MSVPKCFICRGSILAGICISCGRSPEPERISLGEALLGNAVPMVGAGDEQGRWEGGLGPRQEPDISVSLERARLWSRGLEAP